MPWYIETSGPAVHQFITDCSGGSQNYDSIGNGAKKRSIMAVESLNFFCNKSGLSPLSGLLPRKGGEPK
jgi:hypothetical protein